MLKGMLSVVEWSQNSNTSKILFISSLSAILKKGSDQQQPRKSGDNDFLDIQGQLLIESSGNFTSSKLLWLSLLPARMKKIHSKTKTLEW